jgi:TrmH family RNA methyltransferase
VKNISSLQNPLVKQLLHLSDKSRERKKEGVFIIDGWKEIKMAVAQGYTLQTLFVREGSAADDFNCETIELSTNVFDKVSYRGPASGALAIAKQHDHLLSSLKLSETPLLLVLDAIEKPGNLGAILRTADAAGIDGIICCDIHTDIYNPNVIRSSVGCVFTVPVAVATKQETLEYLKQNGIHIFTASLKASKVYTTFDYKQPSAFILGTEATGVDAFWEENSSHNIIIPMRGVNDSLNVSTTAAILLFEALRQREISAS